MVFKRLLFEVRILNDYCKKPIIIKLEDLHRDNKLLIQKLCKSLGISYKKNNVGANFSQ